MNTKTKYSIHGSQKSVGLQPSGPDLRLAPYTGQLNETAHSVCAVPTSLRARGSKSRAAAACAQPGDDPARTVGRPHQRNTRSDGERRHLTAEPAGRPVGRGRHAALLSIGGTNISEPPPPDADSALCAHHSHCRLSLHGTKSTSQTLPDDGTKTDHLPLRPTHSLAQQPRSAPVAAKPNTPSLAHMLTTK